uniref:Hda110 n=1 Tax=Arundo donax TaxID=35708 RepID=A0A0A9DK24_ARUDO
MFACFVMQSNACPNLTWNPYTRIIHSNHPFFFLKEFT